MSYSISFLYSSIRPRLDVWAVRVVAFLTAGMGAINLESAIIPAFQNRLSLIENTLPLEVRHGGRLTAALAGFALFLVAGSLWRRKRTGWQITIVLLVISVITHLIKGLDYEEAGLAFSLIVILLFFRSSFHAASDRPSLRQGLLVLAAAFIFTLIYGSIGFYLLDHHFSVKFGLWAALQQTVIMFTSFYNPGLEPITGFGRYFIFSIYFFGLTTISYALLMLIRPVLVRVPATREEHVRAENIILNHGRTALAHPALFEDKSYFFSPGGSVIAYAVRGRGAMALGDPIGPPEDAPAIISAFQDFCIRNDWTLSFASTLPDFLDAYQKNKFDDVCIGYEAIVVLKEYSLEGSENKNVRNAVSKLTRLGYKAEVHQPPIDLTLVYELRKISDDWLTMRRGGELHFADGWFDDNYIQHCPVIVVYTPDGTPIAFANLVTEYQKNEITLDLMRRFSKVESGTMEFMFATMLEWAKDQGYLTFSLGLSPIAGVGENPADPRVEQTLHRIAETLNRFYNFKGLRSFKEKFHPRWEPRYLVYPGTSSLPLVLTTLIRVHSGNNFLWKYLKK
jgi:phosphatidylglycerol lysyltransferase